MPVPGRLLDVYYDLGEFTIYILYLDESGDPNSWQSQQCFVLGGVAVHEGQVFKLAGELDTLQNHYFPNITVPIAFHATDIRNGRGHFRNFNQSVREQILADVYDVIAKAGFPNLIAFATAMDISAVVNSLQVRHDTLEDISQRFNTFLIRQFKAGYPNKGLLVIDRTQEEHYRELIGDFQKSGTKNGYLGNIVDIPYFARCHETRMLQLADHCAYAVFRYYEYGDPSYLNMIEPRFDRRHAIHPADGLKHITRKPCSCMACSWRKEDDRI